MFLFVFEASLLCFVGKCQATIVGKGVAHLGSGSEDNEDSNEKF